MVKVIGVRFRQAGKIYYFSPGKLKNRTGDHVIVETARGIEYGKVVLAPREVGEEDVVHPLKEVLRVATKDDDATKQNEGEIRVTYQKASWQKGDLRPEHYFACKSNPGTADEISYLEEMYVPHALVGVMAQNGKQKAGNVV